MCLRAMCGERSPRSVRGWLHCPLTESLDTTEYMNGEQTTSWSESLHFAHVRRDFFAWRCSFDSCQAKRSMYCAAKYAKNVDSNEYVRLCWLIGSYAINMSQHRTKSTKRPVWWANTPVSLCIQPAWLGFSLILLWIACRLKKAHAISEDSDQTARMRSLIWVFAGRTRLIVGFVVRWHTYNTSQWYYICM